MQLFPEVTKIFLGSGESFYGHLVLKAVETGDRPAYVSCEIGFRFSSVSTAINFLFNSSARSRQSGRDSCLLVRELSTGAQQRQCSGGEMACCRWSSMSMCRAALAAFQWSPTLRHDLRTALSGILRLRHKWREVKWFSSDATRQCSLGTEEETCEPDIQTVLSGEFHFSLLWEEVILGEHSDVCLCGSVLSFKKSHI